MNLATKQHLMIGIEQLPANAAERAGNNINIKIENGTVRDVLNSVTQSDSRYKWGNVRRNHQHIAGRLRVDPFWRQGSVNLR